MSARREWEEFRAWVEDDWLARGAPVVTVTIPPPPRIEPRHIPRAWARVLRSDPCAYCGAPGKHVDHIVARFWGGEDDWPNLTAACAECNLRKGTMDLLNFLLLRRKEMGLARD